MLLPCACSLEDVLREEALGPEFRHPQIEWSRAYLDRSVMVSVPAVSALAVELVGLRVDQGV